MTRLKILDTLLMKGHCHLDIMISTHKIFFCWVDVKNQSSGQGATMSVHCGPTSAVLLDPHYLFEQVRKMGWEIQI